jgi:hypothetical protein
MILGGEGVPNVSKNGGDSRTVSLDFCGNKRSSDLSCPLELPMYWNLQGLKKP